MNSAVLHVIGFFRGQPWLVTRFLLTSAGRGIAALAVILLVREFLSSVSVGVAASGLTGARIAGGAASPWLIAFLLVMAFCGSALLSYDNQIVQQRLIAILELGTIERVVRHILTLTIGHFDQQSSGDMIHAVCHDISELRAIVFAAIRIFSAGVLAIALTASALWLSP